MESVRLMFSNCRDILLERRDELCVLFNDTSDDFESEKEVILLQLWAQDEGRGPHVDQHESIGEEYRR